VKIKQAAHLIRSAKHAVALTGAGISAPSGIDDFHSIGSGLWEHYDPMEVASLSVFRYNPDKFYKWMQPFAEMILLAEPNPAHLALARLEEAGFLAGVVAQNIDDLHHWAGFKVVFEVHGHLCEAVCVSCYHQPTQDLTATYIHTGEIPLCPDCGVVLKPYVVLIEGQLPHDVFHQSTEMISGSDLILVVGSSLEVVPVAYLPIDPLNAGARLIIINRDPTFLNERADIIIRQDLAVVLPHLTTEVLGE